MPIFSLDTFSQHVLWLVAQFLSKKIVFFVCHNVILMMICSYTLYLLCNFVTMINGESVLCASLQNAEDDRLLWPETSHSVQGFVLCETKPLKLLDTIQMVSIC